MNTRSDRQAGRAEGERRKAAALDLLAAHRAGLIRRGRRALLTRLLDGQTATADTAAEIPTPPGIDPRWRGDVPGPLARAGLIRDTGETAKSCRPEAHARRLTVWALDNRTAALAWLAAHPEPPEAAEAPSLAPSGPPSPPPLALSQSTFF